MDSVKKIKILFTINNLETAGQKYLLSDIVNEIDINYFEPVIVVQRTSNSILEKEINKKISIVQFRFKASTKYFWRLPYDILRFAAKLISLRIDLVLSLDYSSDWTEGLAVKVARLPWIILKTNLVYSQRKWKNRLLLADHIICISKVQLNMLEQFSYKSSLIPIGINIESFQCSNKIIGRSEMGITSDTVVLACVAYLIPDKGHRELIRALEEIKDRIANLKLWVIGNGSSAYEYELKTMVKECGLENIVTFWGARNDVPKILPLADGGILATQSYGRREAFGVAIVEAMASGLPVIATKSGGPEEIIRDGENGWLVEPSSTEALSNAILDFYLNPDKRTNMGLKAKEDAYRLFNRRLMVTKLEELFKRIHSQG